MSANVLPRLDENPNFSAADLTMISNAELDRLTRSRTRADHFYEWTCKKPPLAIVQETSAPSPPCNLRAFPPFPETLSNQHRVEDYFRKTPIDNPEGLASC